MSETDKPRWSLPVEMPTPADPRRARVARVAAWVALSAALIVPVVQFQHQTTRNLRRGEMFDRAHPGWTRQDARDGGPQRPKASKGAIGRWRKAVRHFWQGQNIYGRMEIDATTGRGVDDDEDEQRPTYLHPNMPAVVVLLTPFAYLPIPAAALAWNIAKLAVILATLWMVAGLAAHGRRRIADYVLGLGVAWCLTLIIGDLLHGNTNVFVMGAVVAHLWLFRRGRDLAGGAVLALAICLKMTPAIFLLYWAYQRNWKLLAGTLVGLVLLAVAVPAAAVGWNHYVELTGTWLENLIVPGLIEGAWYPIHVNQSLPGVFSRYFLSGPDGNIFWNPDDNPYAIQNQFGWITLASLSPATVKLLIRAVQVAIVVAVGWAIGWRKLPRDDGRRLLHWGLVVVAWMLLNQRTWDHHAGAVLLADVAIWQAIAFGRFARRVRAAALTLMILAGLLLIASMGGVGEAIAELVGSDGREAKLLADRIYAYGPLFWHFVVLLSTGVLLSVALRRGEQPYAAERQTLSDR